MNRRTMFYLTICAFGFGLASNLQVANLSTILQFSGFKSHIISYLWLIAPITGMFIQPIIGVLSDNIHSRYGRRRPLFLISTSLGVFSLVCLPFAHETLYIVLLIILLDIGGNGNAQLSRALILDNANEKDRTKAFSWSTALAGLGALSGGALPWVLINLFNFSNAAQANNQLPTYVEYTFVIGAVCYLVTSLVTLFFVKEKIVPAATTKLNFNVIHLTKAFNKSLRQLPADFWKLSYILFFGWIAIFSVWNYLTIDIAQTVFHMPSHITDDIGQSSFYLTQANVLSSNYFGLLQLSSTVFALFIPYLNRFFKINHIFALGLGMGGFSLIAIALSTNSLVIAVFIAFYGIGWATLSTCPYTMFGNMISDKNIGYNMGIFNLAIVIPQIIIGLCLGFVYKHLFMNYAPLVILVAGCSLIIAMFLSFNSYFKEKSWFKNRNRKATLLN